MDAIAFSFIQQRQKTVTRNDQGERRNVIWTQSCNTSTSEACVLTTVLRLQRYDFMVKIQLYQPPTLLFSFVSSCLLTHFCMSGVSSNGKSGCRLLTDTRQMDQWQITEGQIEKSNPNSLHFQGLEEGDDILLGIYFKIHT